MVDIREGENFQENRWRLVPEAKPDVFTTFTLKNQKQTVTFYTDQDSISFTGKPGDQYDFIILFNEKDTCWTQIQVVEYIPSATFSKKYIKQHKGGFQFDVPEVQELAHILIAITPTGIADHNMVEHNGEYYNDVVTHFGKYKEEPIVTELDNLLRQGYYAKYKMDACGYYFEGNTIKKDPNYNRLSWGMDNLAEGLIPKMEAFAKKTNFRTFYKEHQAYYQKLIQLMEQQTPIRKQWDWLEKHFPNRYDNYWITFSPMVNGSHSTNRFETENFKQSVMFICGPIEKSRHNEKVVEGLMTRVIFTEIDHNYVNPVSDKYVDDINVAMSNREKWANGKFTTGYGNPYSVFNEYMTWAVFTLYAKEQFNEADFKVINERVEKQMSQWRGFNYFPAFNQKLIELYDNKTKEQKIEDLYPAILAWCAGENV